MQEIDSIKLKDGRKVEIILPSMKYLHPLTDFVNKLSREDTFLSFAGENYSVDFERNWLKDVLNKIKFKKTFIIWAVIDDRIIGAVDVVRGGTRDSHVGKIGLMVDRDFRGLGLGKYLLNKIVGESKILGLKIVSLDVFDDNIAGKKLYEQSGFKECGRLKNGLYRKGKYSDRVTMYLNL